MAKRPRDEVQLSLILRGTAVDSASRTELRFLFDAVIGVNADGRVAFVEDNHQEALAHEDTLELRDGKAVKLAGVTLVQLPPRGFLCPGFVDTHTHAPQFSFAGIGYDLQLLEWLNKYTFPSEARFKDSAFAARVCANAVRRTLRHGTTSALYFATIHTDAAVQLGRIASGLGQRAFVGKVNMDRNAPDFYVESTAGSLAETERFVSAMRADAADGGKAAAVLDSDVCTPCEPLGPPAQPVITPRFVPTCTRELMEGLAAIARRHNLHITSHVSENRAEIAWVAELHPNEKSYVACYDSPGLLTRRTVLAHGVYLTDDELALFSARGASVSHCPLSNSMLRSGLCNVRRLLDAGVSVGLGTDVCGGASPSMLSAIREAAKVSNLVSLGETRPDGSVYTPLTTAEVFHLATVGGAASLDVDGLTGTLAPGSLLDALVIDPMAPNSPVDLYAGDNVQTAFEKWLMLGDDRNTAAVYVHGRCVLDAATEV